MLRGGVPDKRGVKLIPRHRTVFPALTLALAASLSVATSHLTAQDAPAAPTAPPSGEAAPAEAPKDAAAKPGTPEQRAAAEELLKSSSVEKMMTESFNNVLEGQSRQLEGMQIPDDQKAKFAEMQKRSAEIIKEELSWEKIKEDVISAYVESFTQEELKGLVDFYNSPLGKKLIEKQPELMDKTMALAETRMDALRPRMAALATEIMGPMPGGPGAGAPGEAPAEGPPPAPPTPPGAP